ncbi:hypothetical protein MCOR31_001773 [Pyricularia oryzae]|nr:hypothetical protein MCOR31_001773 [Pyricularia oryzae]KAI6417648.1 hypothetical protein MCOR21_011045 [Pyricularia oryzae]
MHVLATPRRLRRLADWAPHLTLGFLPNAAVAAAAAADSGLRRPRRSTRTFPPAETLLAST